MSWRAGLALAIIEALGALTLSLVHSDLRRVGLASKLGLSFGLGLIALAVGLFCASWCGLRPSLGLGLLELSILAGAALIVRGRRLASGWMEKPAGPEAAMGDRAHRWMEWALVLAIAATVILAGFVGLREPLVEWDVLAIWAHKAKVLSHEPVRSSGYFRDASKAYSHLDYPLLWPLAMAWVWAVEGPEVYRGPSALDGIKVLTPALLAAFAACFYGEMRRRHPRLPALVFTAVLLSLPMLLSQSVRLLADVPLSLFALIAFARCSAWLESGVEDDLRLAGCFTAGLLWTKNEGMGLALVLALAAAATLGLAAWRRDGQRWRAAALWLVALPWAAATSWLFFRLDIPKLHEDYGSRFSASALLENLTRLPQVLLLSLDYFGDWEDWLVLWPSLAVVLAATVRTWTRPPICFLALSFFLTLGMYAVAILVSPWEIGELMEMTANRLLLQLAPASIFLAAECVRRGGVWPRNEVAGSQRV